MAGFLSRSAAHAFGLFIPVRTGPVRSREPGKVFIARRLVDLWAGGLLRTPWRRGRCRLPLRLHDRWRWGHAQYLLRSCGLLHCPGSSQRPLATRVAGCQRKLRTPAESRGLGNRSCGLGFTHVSYLAQTRWTAPVTLVVLSV